MYKEHFFSPKISSECGRIKYFLGNNVIVFPNSKKDKVVL